MKHMNVLVCCEESQAVCLAFRNRGHNAFSCDLQYCSGGHPEYHIMGDVTRLINGHCKFQTCDGMSHRIDKKWDLLICHPPCTYLSRAASCVALSKTKGFDHQRLRKSLQAADFLMMFLHADCLKICVENPVDFKFLGLPKYDQIVNPFQFGHPYTKPTCLWLKGLKPLIPTDIVEPTSGSWVYSFTRDRSRMRSKTFPGIAAAMASQWG